MQQFEYRRDVIPVVLAETPVPDLEERFTEMGNDGWDLVSAHDSIRGSQVWSVLYWKRPRRYR